MSVLTTTLSSGGAFAPLGDVTSSARPGVWRACDIPTNHSILCGAKIAAVSETGQYAGFCGQIGGADINISVSKGKALFDVRYDVLYDNGERYRVSPLKVFQGLLYYKQYAVSDNDVVARQQFEETDAHIRNLCDLNDCVRSANVLEQHVCRRIRINDTATEHTFLVGRVCGFHLVNSVPTKWCVSYENDDLVEDLEQEDLEQALHLYGVFTDEATKKVLAVAGFGSRDNNKVRNDGDQSVSTLGAGFTTGFRYCTE